MLFRSIKVGPDNADGCSQGFHSRYLVRIDVSGNKYLHAYAATAARVGDRLRKISSRRADHSELRIEAAHQEAGSSAFEAANWVSGLDLHDRPPPQCGAKLLVDELWAIAKHRVNDPCRLLDVGEFQIGGRCAVHDHKGISVDQSEAYDSTI